ncbi:Beta-TrCP, partial [Araneus ventricosus]
METTMSEDSSSLPQEPSGYQAPMTYLYENCHKAREKNPDFIKECNICTKYFEKWSEQDQIEFVEQLLSKMTHCQHSHVSSFLRPMLQRDFISLLP